jgi:molecular chaperone IbpA
MLDASLRVQQIKSCFKKEKISMSNYSSISDEYLNFSKQYVGFDRLFEPFHVKTLPIKYPPINQLWEDENTYAIELAVAGFKRSDLDIFVEDDILTIRTAQVEKKKTEDEVQGKFPQYISQGIAKRDFNLTFKLHPYVTVASATLNDGILHVSMKYVVPDEKKPKKIDILG